MDQKAHAGDNKQHDGAKLIYQKSKGRMKFAEGKPIVYFNVDGGAGAFYLQKNGQAYTKGNQYYQTAQKADNAFWKRVAADTVDDKTQQRQNRDKPKIIVHKPRLNLSKRDY